jgi:hypothetical protein
MYRKKTWRTEIPVNIGAEQILRYEDIFADFSGVKRLNSAKTDTFVLSDDLLHTSTTQILCKTFDDVCRKLSDIAGTHSDTFSLVYWSGTADTIRLNGTASDAVYNVLSDIGARIDYLCRSLKDTVVIVTSNGGYIDADTVNMFEYPALVDCLYMNPTIEPRAASLFVKPDRKAIFERLFGDIFGSNFLLYPKSEAIRLFGSFRSHIKTDDFIGDYIAAATGRIALRYGVKKRRERAYTGGLTEEEMTIPLIIYGTEKTFAYEPLI